MRGNITALSLLAFLFALQTLAFGTINEPLHIGQHSEHERLSRAAFRCHPLRQKSDGVCFEALTLMQLAGTSGPEGHVGRGANGAVGSPDNLDPVPEGPEAHCDNADFLDTRGLGLSVLYPQSRADATGELQSCVNHLRMRFSEGLDAADLIVDDYARIVDGHVNLQNGNCVFSFPDLHVHMFARAKCSALEGLGRALHGVQDFYAHSNWADRSVGPYSLSNPPGLARTDSPVFLDLRADNNITDQVPFNLTTGCFGGIMTDGVEGRPGHVLEPGSKDCTGRITHHTMNKDNGHIDSHSGETSNPGPNTPRSDIEGNFARAVAGAISDSRRQWLYFREEIKRLAGSERGNMIICALVRDKPTKDCYGRKIAILQDSPMSESPGIRITTMQMPIVHWLKAELEGNDHSEEIGLDNITRSNGRSRGWTGEMQIPLVQAAGGRLDADSFTPQDHKDEAPADISEALAKLASNSTSQYISANKSAVVALTLSPHGRPQDQIKAVKQAGEDGPRIHLGILPSTPSNRRQQETMRNSDTGDRLDEEEALMTAILKTGGTYSRLHHESYLDSFLEHIVSRGLAHIDNARDTATLLPEGITLGDYVSPETEPRRYNFDAKTFHNAVVSVAPLSRDLALRVSLRHMRKNIVLREFDLPPGGNATFRAGLDVDDVPRGNAWFELEIMHSLRKGSRTGGLFYISMESEDVGNEREEYEYV